MKQPTPDGIGRDTAVPVIAEQVRVDVREVETGRVHVRTVVDAERRRIEVPLQRDEVDIIRVPIHRPVDAPVPDRVEGDVLIVSVHEEVVATRLMVTEELHIRRRRTTDAQPHELLLRRERVEIERSNTADDGVAAAARPPQDGPRAESGRLGDSTPSFSSTEESDDGSDTRGSL